MQDGFGEPVVELLAAAVVRRPRRLRRAFGIVGRADRGGRGSDSRGPTTAAPCRASRGRCRPRGTSAFLIAALTKMRSTCGSFAAALITLRCAGVHTFGSTSLRSSATTMVADISSRSCARELAVGHRREPDVGVETDLMAGMAGEHRAAARLRHVADQETAPAGLRRLVGQPLEELHQARMAPVAVARQPHHLPGLAVDRQRHGAGEAALGVEADGARLQLAPAWSCGRTVPWPAWRDRRDGQAAAAASD